MSSTVKESAAVIAAAANAKVRYGERVFFDCKESTRRCKETSSMQHGSSKEIIISGGQNLGDFELKFFVPGNAFVEVMATVMHCGGGCHSDFMNHMFAFNGYTTIREMRNDGNTDVGNTWTNKGGAAQTGGSWQVIRDIVSWNQHGSYSSIMTLRHNKGSYSYGGPYYIRVRSSNHHLGLIKHIDEPSSNCVFDCAKAGCNKIQPKGQVCSCYISGECPEFLFSDPEKKLSTCCGPSDEEDFGKDT